MAPEQVSKAVFTVAIACLLLFSDPAPAGIGPFGGTMLQIVIDPQDADLVFGAVDNGGVYKSTDRGLTWALSSRGLGSWNVSALAIDPSRSDVLFAATPDGVYKTINGGASWELTSLHARGVSAIQIDPTRSDTVYAAISAGALSTPHLYKSTDGGDTWAESSARISNPNMTCMAIDPIDPQTLYIGTSFVIYRSDVIREGTIYRSSDGGATWASVFSRHGFHSLVFDPSNPQVLLAAATPYCDFSGCRDGGIYRHKGGGPWVDVSQGLEERSVTLLSAGASQFHAGSGTKLYVSDSGQHWSRVTFPDRTIRAIGQAPGNDYVLVGVELEAVYRTDDNQSWTPSNRGISGTDVRAIAINPSKPKQIFAGTSHDGIYRTDDGGDTWMRLDGLPILWILDLAMDPNAPDVLYVLTNPLSVFRSTDGGATWTRLSDTIVGDQLIVNPNDSSVYVGARSVFYRSIDGGKTWWRSAPVPGGDAYKFSVDFSHPQIIFSSVYGGVFRSRDGGDSWVQVLVGLQYPVYTVAVDQNNPQNVHVGTDEVWRSTDGGSNWRGASGRLADIQSFSIKPGDSNVIYAATRGGLFVSRDQSENWTTAEGVPPIPVYQVAFDPTDPAIQFVATSNAGILVSDDDGFTWR